MQTSFRVVISWIGEDIRETEKRIKEIYWYIRKDNPTNGITPDDIARAKAYPFENLIKLKRGFAKCPFHNETEASLSFNKKNNTIHCFGACGKTWDTIQFIIDTTGVDFIQAVKALK